MYCYKKTLIRKGFANEDEAILATDQVLLTWLTGIEKRDRKAKEAKVGNTVLSRYRYRLGTSRDASGFYRPVTVPVR